MRACVALYGVYDFTDGNGDRVWPDDGFARLLERRVMKAARAAAPEAYTKASPIHRVRADAPPFFVIHGDRDTLVPVAEARRFATALRAVTSDALVYAEIPGAQHAFEIFPSLRSTFVIHGVERFLAHVYSRYLVQRGARPALAAASGGD